MFSRLKIRSNEIRNRLTRITENEPLSLLSTVLIIFLDLFVLVNLFNGLDNQSKQLTSPGEFIPYVCRDIVIDKNWVDENKISELSNLVLKDQRSYWELDLDNEAKHPICEDLYVKIKAMKGNKSLITYFDERDKLVKRYNSYDDYQKQINSTAREILNDIAAVDQKINALGEVNEFWTMIGKKSALSETLTKDLQVINFTYPVKRLAVRILFLIPVFVLLLLWNSRSMKRNRNLQAFVSSHLIIISLIPAFFELCQAVFDIIPHKIFRKLIEILEACNLIAIWYYVLIILAIFVSLLLIFFLQKKVFTREKLMRRRLEKKKCVDCGRPLSSQPAFCPFCGSAQKVICKNCNQDTFRGAAHCTQCGKEPF